MPSVTSMNLQTTNIFEQVESNVRSYCRAFPIVFDKAKNDLLYDEAGTPYIDFFAGAGALNYGHNNEHIKQSLLTYLQSDAIAHGLDMHTSAKRNFLETFSEIILQPRNLSYKVQFPGPTGTNAVEAAMKLARNFKERTNIFAFMGGYHGMTLAGLAATGNRYHRQAAGVPLSNITFMPYPHGFMNSFDSIAYIDNVLRDTSSGIDLPAAIIVETIQAEGGVIVAPGDWLRRLRTLCDEHDILLICDDIQVGCGRSGPFFSFEHANIVPDIVLLSKSISGYGLPLSLVLHQPELDIWQPAEHNGTFRGNQLAFVGGTAALNYWLDHDLGTQVAEKGRYVSRFLQEVIQPLDERIQIRGKGLIWGIDLTALARPELTNIITTKCFDRCLIIENCGRGGQVLKILPPLTIDQKHLQMGCAILQDVLTAVI